MPISCGGPCSASAWTPKDLDDALQEVFVVVQKKLAAFRGDARTHDLALRHCAPRLAAPFGAALHRKPRRTQPRSPDVGRTTDPEGDPEALAIQRRRAPAARRGSRRHGSGEARGARDGRSRAHGNGRNRRRARDPARNRVLAPPRRARPVCASGRIAIGAEGRRMNEPRFWPDGDDAPPERRAASVVRRSAASARWRGTASARADGCSRSRRCRWPRGCCSGFRTSRSVRCSGRGERRSGGE